MHLEDGGEILLSDFLEPISNEAQDDTITNITELSANNLLSTFGFLSQKEIDVEEMGINAEFTDITKDVDESGAEFFPPPSPPS